MLAIYFYCDFSSFIGCASGELFVVGEMERKSMIVNLVAVLLREHALSMQVDRCTSNNIVDL